MLHFIVYKNRHFKIIITLLALLIALPSLWLLFNGLWYIPTLMTLNKIILWEYIKQTFWLCLAVSFFSLLLGIFSSLLVTFFEFKGRKFLEWALILPFMFPAYILAYFYTDFFEYSGFLQEFLRKLFSWQTKADYWFPEIRGMGGAIFTLTLALYPYVYIITRNNFSTYSETILQSGQLLGKSFWQNLFSLILPLSKKSIFLSFIIIIVHCLQDFGTVEYFSIYTFSLGIYDLWLNRGNFTGATALASILMLGVLFLVLLENKIAPQNYNINHKHIYQGRRIKLGAFQSSLAVIFCSSLIIIGFILPASLVIYYSFLNYTTFTQVLFWQALFSSLQLAILATFFIIALSFILAYMRQRANATYCNIVFKTTILGYALPGTVLAIGIVLVTTKLDIWLNNFFPNSQLGLLFSASIITIIFAYLARFFVIPQSIFGNSMLLVTPSLDGSGRNLGYANFRILKNIYLPIINKGVLSAFLILFVEIIKELPLTLILRPLEFETLATLLYQFASDEMVEKAAVIALAIVLISSLPVLFICLTIRKATNKT